MARVKKTYERYEEGDHEEMGHAYVIAAPIHPEHFDGMVVGVDGDFRGAQEGWPVIAFVDPERAEEFEDAFANYEYTEPEPAPIIAIRRKLHEGAQLTVPEINEALRYLLPMEG